MPEKLAPQKLAPLAALGGIVADVRAIGTIRIAENPDVAMASLAARTGRGADVAAAIARLTGLTLPGPGGMARSGGWAAFWTGPDQWMVTAPFATHEEIAGELTAATDGAASVTEQTDGWVRFEVTGARAADLFERLCNVDIRAMKECSATRTQIEHLGSFLLCHRAGTDFSVMTLRSAARSMMHALDVAARSLG